MLKRVCFCLFMVMVMAFSSCVRNSAVQIPINEFFGTPQKNAFKISPDGKYISYLKPYKDHLNLFIESLADGKEHMATSFTDYSLRDYYWTYNDQIVFSQDVIATDQLKTFALDIATMKLHLLMTGNKVRMKVISRIKEDPNIINVAMNKDVPTRTDVYRLNIKTGEIKLYLVNPGNFTEWFPDPDGKIRLVKASDGVNETILYRADDNKPFKQIITNNFKTRVEPIAFTGKKNDFYALSNVNRDKTALVEIDAETGKEVKEIYANNNADITSVEYSKNRHIVEYASWEEAYPEKHFLDKCMADIYKNFEDQLKGYEIRIVDRDSAENKFIISSYTDRDAGSFYLFERSKCKLTKLGDINSGIKLDELCAMKPISYKASDGTIINGYLTFPKGKDSTNLPVVVMPHDWSYGATSRNSWGYNPDVQFLANRGYAVFQVNYRGSTGYGKAFHSAGFKQVGGKIQQDITDGVNWLIANKTANPKKIAIFGGGFGGFSALYGVSFHPGLYNCAIVQYGIINFFTYIKDVPPFLKPSLQMMYEMVGNPETDADQLRAISPVFHTDRIKAPLLIFQGAKDPRANISELNQFVIELHKQNVPVSYFLKENERAFFRSERNRMQMYSEIEKFLDANMRVKQ
ncbi:MAG: alpha/beta hydrolase family protein [Mucilaginibacter sp.]